MEKSKERYDHRGKKLPQNISQYRNMRYVWRKTIQGKKYVLSDNSLEELEKKIIRKEESLKGKGFSQWENFTLNEWFDEWLPIYKANVKPITKANYEKLWKWYIVDSKIGCMSIDRINRIHIVGLYQSLTGDLSLGSIRNIHALLSNCFNDAVIDRVVTANPCRGALNKLCIKQSERRKALTVEEQQLFLQFVASHGIYKKYLPLFVFALSTGCRIGEILGMRWEDIDFKKNLISINHTLSYKSLKGYYDFFITTPKTESSIRHIPMIESLRNQLMIQKKQNKIMGIKPDFEVDGYRDFVFVTKNGKPLLQTAVNQVIRQIIDECNQQNKDGIILPDFTAHVLRHTFCSRLCENETNIKVIQQVMGHARIETTMDIYAHITKEKVNECMQNLENKILAF